MWVLYVLSAIGAVAIIALLGLGVSKVIDLFDKIDSIDHKCERIDARYWGHERELASIHSELRYINNYVNDLSTRMDTTENAIRGMTKGDAEND